MANEAITSGKITVNDPLKSDIAKLFDSREGVETLQDIHLKGDVNTDVAFAKFNEILSKPELSKQDVLNALNKMNELDMLWHTSRSGWSSAAKPKKEVIESMASHLFATVQYNKILASAPEGSQLKAQLEASDNKENVIAKLMEIDTAEEVTELFNAVVSNTKNWEDTQTAMKALGLRGNIHDTDALFAEVQYERILGLAEENSILHKLLIDSKPTVILKLKGGDYQVEVEAITELFDAVNNLEIDRAALQDQMEDLGLAVDGTQVKELFAENQYKRILEKVKDSNPKLHAQLSRRRVEFINALVNPPDGGEDIDSVEKIDKLLDKVSNPGTEKPSVIDAMKKLGLEHGNLVDSNELFGENQYIRICTQVEKSNPKLYEQLSEKPNDEVQKALGQVADLAKVNELLDNVRDKNKDKLGIQQAMKELGLKHNENTKVKELFAVNQYARILEETLANSPILHKHLKDKDKGKEVIVALSNANIEDLAGVNKLVEAVKNPAIDKPGIKTAMKELGLGEDDEIANELFAEAQYNRILKLANEKRLDPLVKTELEKQLGDRRDAIINELKKMDSVENITTLFKKLNDPNVAKDDIIETMNTLGLDGNSDDSKKLFAENQYKIILDKVQKSNPILYAELKAKPENVIKALVIANKEDSAGVKLLVDAATKTDSDRLTIRSAIGALGLDPDKDQKIFAENQYYRILAAAKDTNPKLYAQLKAKPNDVIQALVNKNVADLAGVNLLIEAVTNKESKRELIKNAMEDLGLDHGNDDKVNELFGENQYNKLAEQIKTHERTNPKLYAYYNEPGKKAELITKLGQRIQPIPKHNLDQIIELLLSEPGKRIEQQKEFSKSIEKHIEKLKTIDELDEVIHLYNPAFQVKARKDPQGMQNKYKELSRQCTVMINQLELQLKELDAFKENLRSPSLKGKTDTAQQADILMNEKTEKRLKEQLGFYRRVQEKIDNHILIAIEHATQGSKKYIYDPDSVASYNLPREQAKDLSTIKDKTAPQNTYLLTQRSSGTLDFLLEDKPKAGEVRCFDVVFSHHRRDTGVDVKTEARFTYDANPPATSGSSMLKGDEISKTAPSKFEVLQFPRQPKPPAEQLSPRELAKAQVEFSMTMAIQALSTLDGPPTKDKPLVIRGFSGKEDEVAFLWTALAILGEKNPKMKFSPDAILVRGNSEFNPNEQRKRRLGVFEQFTDESYKKQVFDAFTSVVNNQSQDLTKMTEKRFDNKAIDKVEAGTDEATKEYKEKLLNGKKPAVKEQIENAEQRVKEEEEQRLGL
ncbi:hypothetical protein A6J40_08495 [Legionella longbeachae]|uniref:hypothetical protein n=1 Tax=Legionella longbeachae TaxID=450 RepID=UPI0001BEC3E5|nr:hypothetical protein [Legionella longbeachae]VEE01427.1 interaptin [Legionella oakridgensis]ARB92210.1 hypothetical protein A6J40_08495 [Legionella longbeachae]EEZ96095.1 conserved hypothetical protein [Legionella longbeachae D-4968]QIN31366.1 hypothetical protein GCB94_04025 [Legionella longbeachae]RZV26074.1 hypothetical protein EKG34_06475 [Legionella longbeachae]